MATLQSSTVLKTFFLAMSLNVEAQKRAQKELETQVGLDRLPDFSDRGNLPYIDALIREALRWIPSLPLGLSHCTINDDELGGYFIPAGTIVTANIW